MMTFLAAACAFWDRWFPAKRGRLETADELKARRLQVFEDRCRARGIPFYKSTVAFPHVVVFPAVVAGEGELWLGCDSFEEAMAKLDLALRLLDVPSLDVPVALCA